MLGALAACGTDEGPPDARMIDAPPPGGTFSLTWTLHDGADTPTCEQIGSPVVAVTIKPDNAGFGTIDTFSCSSAKGTTRSFLPGKYTLSIELDGAGGALSPAQQFQHLEIQSLQDTPIGALDFPVVAKGGLTLKVAAQGVTPNCTTGAKIENMTLELNDSTGACVTTTFMVGATTYTSTCPTPTPGPCIERDTAITVTGARSGQSTIVVDGLIGGKACWTGAAGGVIPTGNAVKDLGTASLVHDASCP